MIVPFLFGVEENPVHYLWIFYKYMDFCLKNDYPIIAQEEYFKNPSYFKNNGHFAFNNIKNGYNFMYEFDEPTDEKMQKLKKESITLLEQEQIFSKYINRHEASIYLMKQRNKNFEKLIQKKLDMIMKSENKKIDAILSWIYFPSLEYVAKKNGIELIIQEMSTVRKGNYNCYLGYNTFNNKYESDITKKKYNKFLKEKRDNKFFSRKELLALFLNTENLNYISELECLPKFQFGVDLGAKDDAYFEAFSKYNHNYLLKKCTHLVGENNIIGRTHPMRPSLHRCLIMDESKNSIEWILKCKRIVSTVSNVGFEAMLLGRTSYIIGDNMPFSCCSVNSLEYLDESVASVSFLNYIIFCYFAPFELMFNNEYLLWRISKPSECDIYNYNLNFIMKKYDLNQNISDKTSEKRLIEILKKVHKLNNNSLQRYLVSKTDKFYQDLEKENNELKIDILNIKNSKGWKILEKLRKIKNIVRR